MTSTANDLAVSVASSFDEWQNLVSRSFVSLGVTRDGSRQFRGRIRRRVLSDVSLCEIAASSHTVRRTSTLISRDAAAFFKLSLQLSGTGLLIQDGREAVLAPGDLAIYDTSRPYTLTHDGDFRSLIVMFPRTLVDLPVDAVGRLTAVRMPGDTGLGRMISPFLVHLAQNLDQFSGGSGLRLAHNALDLVTTMFADELGTAHQTGNPNHTLVDRIRDYIDANLGDPDLCPAKVAAAHFISTRHLHNLFRAEGTTVATWIRSRRLERCRRDLLDPLHCHQSVAALAARWGFLDAAHFSRIFKAAFDLSPSAYRQRRAS
ncbi:AraC family transcriptional regulator [Sphaerisporangium krabiense]|uniref:AraC-like DNA-binding protein n=1 Tax=Sphaerisporangium krabiense TaxID=763782 RepID=A0A7W8Z291_9ACTN|nr:helix-turn-helix domain-containing protein [Sphaerisporangium krabiense]MBB5625905.1 AraC-like DNA-binding protein [Sphaerisporangium krabiense]GII64708.1 AraC family transcriptional regulator [Sphaerisporangium krabiense]